MSRRGFTLTELIVVIAIIAVLVALLFPSGNTWVAEIPFTLALGWVRYVWRVVPKLNPDPWTVGVALLCLLGVIVGAHYFLRWLYARSGEQPRAWPWKRTVRCVGLVLCLFTAGIAVLGMIHQTSWLVRSPEPWREGSRVGARMRSANNLRQIGIAADSHHEWTTPKHLPTSTFDPTGRPLHSWQTALLPFVEQDKLYKQIDLTKPWTHPANAGPLGEYIPTYASPSFGDEKIEGYGASHYAGNAAVVLGGPKTLASFPAGTSNTILAGEVSSNFRAWGDPLNARDPRVTGPYGFGGPNRRPAQFVMLDGSVRTFDPAELEAIVGKPLD